MPDHIVTMVKVLFTKNRAFPILNGKHKVHIDMTNGLKQGCPLSRILFNLALDPLITKLDTLDYLDTRAYCDDIAMRFTQVTPICQALSAIQDSNSATGMTSNTDKTKYISTLYFRPSLNLDLPDRWKLASHRNQVLQISRYTDGQGDQYQRRLYGGVGQALAESGLVHALQKLL